MMKNKKNKHCFILEASEFHIYNKNGNGDGDGDGYEYGDDGWGNGEGYGVRGNGYGNGDGNRFPEDPGSGYGIGSFIIEEEEDKVNEE